MNTFILSVLGLVVLSSALSACSSSNTSNGNGTVGGTASYGGAQSTGGDANTGGSLASTGGSLASTGGSLANTGGSLASAGGSLASAGGSLASTGGSLASTGGSNSNAGGSHAGGSTGVGADLTANCNLEGQVAAQFNCPGFTSQQAIVTQCMQSNGSLPASCQTPLDSLDACVAQQPASSLQCSTNNDGTVELKTGFCTAEGNALVSCALGGTSTGCTDLVACCAQLTGTNQTNCQQIISQGVDAVCGIALSTYQSLGTCT